MTLGYFLRGGPSHRGFCDAAFVHWTGNSGRDWPDTFQLAGRPPRRTLDRPRKLSRHLAVYRRYRRRLGQRDRLDAVPGQPQAVRGCIAGPVELRRPQAARGGGPGAWATTARGLRPPKLDRPCNATSNGLRLTRNSIEAISLAETPSISPINRKVT